MVVRMRIVTVGTGRVGRAFSVVSDRLDNLAPAFRIIAQVIRQHIADEITSEGRGTWEPLNPTYAERKALRWGPQPMLVASGGMFDSLTREGAANNVTVIQGDRMRVGSTDPKLRFHQSTGARRVIPRRAPINVSPELRQRWMTIIESYINESS